VGDLAGAEVTRFRRLLPQGLKPMGAKDLMSELKLRPLTEIRITKRGQGQEDLDEIY